MSTQIEDLSYLSRRAHTEARAAGEPVPASMGEFDHLPMRVVNGVPELDGTRMREDQRAEAIEILERKLGVRARQATAFEAVENFMLSYATNGNGVRQTDICSQTGLSKPSVLTALRVMMEESRVLVKEEKTRGTKGSRRKRYYMADNFDQDRTGSSWVTDPSEGATIHYVQDGKSSADTGIRHHGTAVQGVTCGCTRCFEALRDGMVGEVRSAARKRGDRAAAFEAGLLLRRMRREEAARAFKALLAVAT